MFFRQVYDESLAQAAYLIGCQRTGEAIVVDPARDVDRYIDLAVANGLKITAITETHIHADFLSGARELAERTGARLYVSDEGDADWKYGWLDDKRDGGTYDHVLLHHDDTFRVGNIEFRVMHTPGHTPEHISFLVTDLGGGATQPMGALTGDFVFVGDLGRPDLLETAAGIAGVKEDSARTLHRSTQRFLALDDYLQVWPAHGAGSACGKALGAVPQSTVGYERRYNGALQLSDDGKRFVDFILEGQPEPPLYFGRMKQQNRDGVPLLGSLPRPAEMRPADVEKVRGSNNGVVVDTRPWSQFRSGHLPGALFAPLGSNFHSVAGSYIQPEQTIVLVVEPGRLDAAVRELVRIGLDHVIAYMTPETLEASGLAIATVSELDVAAARTAIDNGDVRVVDVRRSAELAQGSIADDAVHAPHTRLPNHLDEIPKDRPLLVHCASGVRSALASAYLLRNGYDVINLTGGYGAWAAATENQAAHSVKGA